MNEWLTIAVFDNNTDAHLLKSSLELKGVPTQLFDENSISIDPLHAISLGGIKLKVQRSEYRKLRIALKELDQYELLNDLKKWTCPECEGILTIQEKNTPGFIGSILTIWKKVLGKPLQEEKSCTECGFSL